MMRVSVPDKCDSSCQTLLSEFGQNRPLLCICFAEMGLFLVSGKSGDVPLLKRPSSADLIALFMSQIESERS
ncbi:hypothetical protein L596_010383 [Steinernema carpocapsae]|uniref:Uncharacterized protein n=1 Tax=Steinernema carpocapsae TaxID=34508 RepID=A0A4U5PI86_STECR|nr:hypothetical protein L596_010383 [Steinernema carpocapsae]